MHDVYRTDQSGALAAGKRNLRFLANVDPVDVARALNGLSQETTLVVVVSKTFTTAETMLNARTVRYVNPIAPSQAIASLFKSSATKGCTLCGAADS